jgi:hypothetical protein
LSTPLGINVFGRRLDEDLETTHRIPAVVKKIFAREYDFSGVPKDQLESVRKLPLNGLQDFSVDS